jgi:hypothetical protein
VEASPTSHQHRLSKNSVEAVVSDLEGFKGVNGFQQLLNRIEGWCSSGSGSTPSDQTEEELAPNLSS